jgi:L-ascorbate metabolism protein UlaG (beta-lactamase superfamily)
MDITYLGLSSFKVKGKSATLVTDPYDSNTVGLKFPKTKADIVTVSHDHSDHNAVGSMDGESFVISGPGEYEVSGVFVQGFESYHDESQGTERGKNTIYHIQMDDVNLLHLGDLGHMLDSATLEELPDVDVLFVPVGGHFTINAEVANTLVNEIEPSIVIPMHYLTPQLNQQVFGVLAPVSTFLSEVGKPGVTPVAKLIVKPTTLPVETDVVVFE